MKMTALEMAMKFNWACLTVNFGFGHVTVEGQTRIVQTPSAVGNAVWVGCVALAFNTVVTVSETVGSGAKVGVYRCNQVPQSVEAA